MCRSNACRLSWFSRSSTGPERGRTRVGRPECGERGDRTRASCGDQAKLPLDPGTPVGDLSAMLGLVLDQLQQHPRTA